MNKKQTNIELNSEAGAAEMVAPTHVTQDLKNSVLIVSVVLNLFVFTAWVVLLVTSQFDTQFANMLFGR